MFRSFIVILSIVSVMDFWSYIPFLEGKFGILGWLINTFLFIYYFLVIIFKKKLKCKYEKIDNIGDLVPP